MFDIGPGFCTLDVAAYPADRAGFYRAGVAELADAHGSGPCTRKGVGVRSPFFGTNKSLILSHLHGWVREPLFYLSPVA